jgi:hypothetical protein
MCFFSTKDVAKRLQMRPDRLQKAIWLGEVEQPQKSPAGDFLWTEKDIISAAWSLHQSHLLGGGPHAA